jgi:hypothetical protein
VAASGVFFIGPFSSMSRSDYELNVEIVFTLPYIRSSAIESNIGLEKSHAQV